MSADCEQEIGKIIASEIVKKYAIIFSIAISAHFTKFNIDGGIEAKVLPCFTSKQRYVNNVSEYSTRNILHDSATDIKSRFDDFNEKGSGWTLERFRYLDVNISQVNDLRGGCGIYIKNAVSQHLVSRRAGLINIRNSDSRCLLYCIAASFVCHNTWSNEKKSDPCSYEDFVQMLRVSNNLRSLDFPVSLNDITFLEEINRNSVQPIKFRVNVFREDLISHKVQLIRKSTFTTGKVVNDLLTDFELDGSEYTHYILIHKHSFFKKKYVNPDTGETSRSSSIFCSVCFAHFRSSKSLETHSLICNTKPSQIRLFPTHGEKLSYSEHQYNYKRIFTGYCDFESLLKETDKVKRCESCITSSSFSSEKECNHSYTVEINNHVPISVSFIIIDRYGALVHEFVYTGIGCVVRLIKDMIGCEEKLVNTTKFNKYMIFGEKEKKYHESTNVCHICNNNRTIKGRPEKVFTEMDIKVRDHDHITGKYLGPAHQSCNLNKRREKPFLSVFFHNFSGYDCHLILPFLTKSCLPEVETISIIPKGGEKFMSVRINTRITLLDSMNFLQGSLEKLFDSIKDTCKFKFLKQSSLISVYDKGSKRRIPRKDASDRLKLMLLKGIFPYEFAKRLEDFDRATLAEKDDFYNSMTGSTVTNEQYNRAKKVWGVFKMKNMKEYMETYCLSDTFLLCEVFERFRNESMQNFGIEPGHFLSLPGFAYQAFLKTTGVELDYISNEEIYLMLSENIRGGHSFASQRYEESSIFKNMASASCRGGIPQNAEKSILLT